MENTLFYSSLPLYKESINKLFSNIDQFKRVPDEWHVIITDIKGSTASVEKGLSELVNLIATGSIIASLNIASKHKIDIPFFFGGDGATLLIPSILLKEIMDALILHKDNIQKEFNIYLRVGSMSVSDIYKNNQELKIAKARVNKLHSIPVIIGNGLHFAEASIKSKDIALDILNTKKTSLNLEGMECGWDKIPPPENSNEVVSLLINAISESKQAAVFQQVLKKTDEIYGSLHHRNPISVSKLEMSFNYQRIKTEMKMNHSKFRIITFLMIGIRGFVGKYFYLPNKSGQKYLKELSQLSDVLVIDGRINMVISGTIKQRKLLTEYLDDLEKKKSIIYGINVSERSIMSCYVRNRDAKHIHFVDGGGSGYTRAARVLKEKMRDIDLF